MWIKINIHPIGKSFTWKLFSCGKKLNEAEKFFLWAMSDNDIKKGWKSWKYFVGDEVARGAIKKW